MQERKGILKNVYRKNAELQGRKGCLKNVYRKKAELQGRKVSLERLQEEGKAVRKEG